MEEQQKTVKAHKLVVNNRKTSMVTGVLDVLSFDLNEILLETEQGAVSKRNRLACEPPQCGKGRSRFVGNNRQCFIF